MLRGIHRKDNNPWVIAGRKPDSHLTDLQHPWRRIRARAGLDDVRIHDLRHSFASGGLLVGEGLPMIGKLLGHTQVQTTARYAHLANDPVKSAANRIANLIPLLTLGIPGNIAAALLVSAFMIHGVQPGPLLFEEQGRLIYGMFGAMLIANFCNLGVGQIGMRFWALIVSAPGSVVYPAAMLLCLTGSYVAAGGIFGVFVMIGMALVGYLMRYFGYSIVAFIVAFILTPQLESAILKTRLITENQLMAVLDHPIALVLLALSVLSVIYLGPKRRKGTEASDDTATSVSNWGK